MKIESIMLPSFSENLCDFNEILYTEGQYENYNQNEIFLTSS